MSSPDDPVDIRPDDPLLVNVLAATAPPPMTARFAARLEAILKGVPLPEDAPSLPLDPPRTVVAEDTTPDGVRLPNAAGIRRCPRHQSRPYYVAAGIALAVAAVALAVAVLVSFRTPSPPDGTLPGGDIARAGSGVGDAEYRFRVSTDGSGRASVDTAILYRNDTWYIKDQSFPATDYKTAWFVKCGPYQAARIHQLERRGDRFVANCKQVNGKQAGFVLIILVLSRQDWPVRGDEPEPEVEVDLQDLDSLSLLYREPTKNAEEIESYLAKFRRAWGLPEDARLVPRPFDQVTSTNPGVQKGNDRQP